MEKPPPKAPLTEEEKLAKVMTMKQTGKAKQAANAFADVKKTTEKEADYIMNKITGAAQVPADDLQPLVAINIVMTTAKANWDILIHFFLLWLLY